MFTLVARNSIFADVYNFIKTAGYTVTNLFVADDLTDILPRVGLPSTTALVRHFPLRVVRGHISRTGP